MASLHGGILRSLPRPRAAQPCTSGPVQLARRAFRVAVLAGYALRGGIGLSRGGIALAGRTIFCRMVSSLLFGSTHILDVV